MTKKMIISKQKKETIMNFKIKNCIPIIILVILAFSSQAFAQDKTNSDKTKSKMKKMGCCKNMNHSDHEMKSEKTEMNEQDKIDLEKIDKNKDGKVYQCPMCVGQLADEPGKCSKCEMDLKEVSIEDAQKALGEKSHDMMDHSKMDGHKMDHSKMMNHEIKHADADKMYMKKNSIVREGEIDLTAIDKNGDKKVFQDPMDWNVISDEAGECPLCGMKLKEVTLKKAKENLKKHGFKIK